MSEDIQDSQRWRNTRRTVLKATGAATAASALGLTGSAAAETYQTSGNETGGNQTGGDQTDGTPTEEGQGGLQAWMYGHEVHPNAVVRIQSPTIDVLPDLQGPAGNVLGNATMRIAEYFNTSEETRLFVPEDQRVQQGQLYQLQPGATPVQEAEAQGLVRVQLEAIQEDQFTFDVTDEIDLLDEGGGEAAVRPQNFSPGALFRITSGTLGWLPQDVEGSGWFTDYNGHHAQYLGTGSDFLFFPQEDAQVEPGQLYVMWDDFELFTPAGNLVAAEFDAVDEATVPVDDEFL